MLPAETRLFLSASPYVCPEPVLATRSFLVQNGAKDMRFLAAHRVQAHGQPCKKTRLFVECLPYVCPEPVLVKGSCLV